MAERDLPAAGAGEWAAPGSARARPPPRAQRPHLAARLLQDTQEEGAEPSHTATATLVLEVQPADLRPPWFLPCAYADSEVCVQAQYHGAVPTGHRLVLGMGGAVSALGGGKELGALGPNLVIIFKQMRTFSLNYSCPTHGGEW